MRPEWSVQRSRRTFWMHFQEKDFYQLSPGLNDSQDPCWKPVNPHISLCSHTGQYIARLSLLQPFSFTHRSHRCDCSTMAWRKWLIKSSRRSAQWYLNTLQPCRKRRQCHEGIRGTENKRSLDERLNRLRKRLPSIIYVITSSNCSCNLLYMFCRVGRDEASFIQ